MNINQRIKYLRENMNMSQKELAEKINLNTSVMNRIESGERPIRDEELVKLSEIFDVSADYLLGRTDNRNLTVKDEKSIKNDLKKMMTDLRTGQAGPAFYGDTELDEEELDLIEDAMELALKTIKLRNKEKYTPKKYKKDK